MATEIEQAIPHLDGESLNCAKSVEACHDIFHEVMRAMAIYKGFQSQHESYAVILEELDEYWTWVKCNPKKLTDIGRETRLKEMRTELIQTAAMCVRTIVDLGL